MTLVYWASIIQQGAAQLERPIKMRCLQYASISAFWTFYTLLSACAFLSKGFLSVHVSFLQMAVSAGFLLLVSIVFLVYGLRVHNRLQAFEFQQQLRVDQARAQISGLQDGVDRRGLVDKQQEKQQVPVKKSSHSSRIRKILFIVESFSLFVVVTQVRSYKSAGDCSSDANSRYAACSWSFEVAWTLFGAGLCKRIQVQPHPLLDEPVALVSGSQTASNLRTQWAFTNFGVHSGCLCVHYHLGVPQHAEEGKGRRRRSSSVIAHAASIYLAGLQVPPPE